MRSILIILFFMLIYVSAKSQDWQHGAYIDNDGNKATGLIRRSERQPIKNEAAIEFKDDRDHKHYLISAGDLKAIIIGRDSFIVADAPPAANWKNEYDFVRVVFDEDEEMKLFQFTGAAEADGGGSVQPEFGVGIGAGFGGYGSHFGGGVGGGISIPIGGGGGRGGYRAIYYYGSNTAHMKPLTDVNFVDIMSQMMGDEADIVDAIRQNQYNIGNIDRLVRDYYKAVAKENK